MGVVALALVHHGAHAVAGDGAGDEHHVAVLAQPRHALAAVGERVDRQLQLLAALGPLTHVDAPPTASTPAAPRSVSSSSSAFCA